MIGRSRHLLAPVLAAYFLVVAAATSPAQLDGRSVAVLAVLYLALAHLLVGGAWLLAGLGGAGPLLAGALVAAPSVWHLREQLGVPRSPWGTALSAALLAFALAPSSRHEIPSRRRAATTAALAALALASAVGATFRFSHVDRWRLLRHNKLIGTPAHFVFDRPVDLAREALFTRLQGDLPRARSGSAAVPSPVPAPRRHLVLVVVDTLRADAIAARGGRPGPMPETTRLASLSYRFDDVIANASWTRPSVASILTGRLPEEHGALDRGDALAPEVETLAERLEGRGYLTLAFVSNWAAVGAAAGFDQGFARFQELRGRPYARASAVVDAVEVGLEARSPRRPYFLYVHFLDPHRPYLADPGSAPGALTTSFPGGYEAELRYVDRELGRLVAMLERRLDPPPWIVVTSDHGEEFGEHGETGHGHSLYPEVLRIPAFLYRPGEPGGAASERLEARDLFDLVLRAAEHERFDPAGWARSRRRESRYASVYLTTASSWHRPYLAVVAARRYENDRHALVWSAYGDTRELYDRSVDPEERANIVARSPGAVRELERSLDRALSGWAPRAPAQPSEEVQEQLRALGYVR